MRADRLVATLLLLQARGRVSARELAEELEVSVATARRDLEALSTAGIPVYPQPGRGGGWQILGGGRTDLSGLTAGEARSLFLLLGPAAGGSGETRSALRKLARALPETFRDDAVAAADAVVVDDQGWGALPRARSPLLDDLQTAVVERRRVLMSYEPWNREVREREIEPWGLVDKDGVWYLLGRTERGERTYRVDRIRALTVTDARFERPDSLDLDSLWQRARGEIEEQRAAASAVVRTDARLLPVLRSALGASRVEVLSAGADSAVVRVSAQTELLLARTLAGWGGLAEVVEPVAVRQALAALGAELVELYGPRDV